MQYIRIQNTEYMDKQFIMRFNYKMHMIFIY